MRSCPQFAPPSLPQPLAARGGCLKYQLRRQRRRRRRVQPEVQQRLRSEGSEITGGQGWIIERGMIAVGRDGPLSWVVRLLNGRSSNTSETPGESELEAFPEVVWNEYDCDNQKRPFFIIEKNDLLPEKVDPAGADFRSPIRVRDVPQSIPTEVVQGETLEANPITKAQPDRGRRRIRFTKSSPGRWVVDAIVHLPEEAESRHLRLRTRIQQRPGLGFRKEPDLRGRGALSPSESSETAAPRVVGLRLGGPEIRGISAALNRLFSTARTRRKSPDHLVATIFEP